MRRFHVATLAIAIVIGAARSGLADTAAHFFLLDLRGNGFALSGANKAGGTRWTEPQTDDAFLAVDASGLRSMGIDVTTRDRIRLDGTTLVSTNLRIVADGQTRDIDRTWQMLAALDTNRDGKLDPHDLTWVHLRLFIDKDGDGRIASTEVHAASDGSIASISTKPGRDPRTDTLGNVLTESWLTSTDGRTRNSADVRFAALTTERLATR